MEIYKHSDILANMRRNKSYSLLAERVPVSENAPHRINIVKEPILARDTVLLVLGGTGGVDGHNGLLKYVDNFVKQHPLLQGTRVCMPICFWGPDYKNEFARLAFSTSKNYPILWAMLNLTERHKLTHLPSENYTPKAIEDIYNSVILPKITHRGTERLSKDVLLRNLRTITILAYCAGGHTAMKLEELIKQNMLKLGYSDSEIKIALNQIVVVGHAMDCPYEKSDLRFFSFASVSDPANLTQSAFKTFLQTFHPDFGMMHFNNYISDTFYCTQMSSVGIEGNDNIAKAIPIDEYMAQREKEAADSHTESETDTYNEHTFIGFVPKQGFSNGAKNLQKTFQEVLVGALVNSLSNARSKDFIPLAPVKDLVCDDELLNRADLEYIKNYIKYLPFAASANILKYIQDMRLLYHTR